MDKRLNLEEIFNSAVSVVRNLPKEGPFKPSDDLKLKLYAYFKQATHGPNDTPKPRFYQIVEAYKWDAWHKLAAMSKEEAMSNYVNELKQIMISIPEEDRQLDDEDGRPFFNYCLNECPGRLVANVTVQNNESHLDSQPPKSSSSSGSSVSILDGNLINIEIEDQIASAILKLQRGLEETNKRLAKIESQAETNRRWKSEEKKSSKFNVIRAVTATHWFYLAYPFLVYFIINKLANRKNCNQSRR